MKLQLLLTGSELMSGQTTDSNSVMIAQQVAQCGFTVYRKVTIGDDFKLLVQELEDQSLNSDVIIVNGGLGPTVDDLTAQALAELTGRPIEQHPQALAHLQQWCGERKFELNDANLKQSFLPAGTDIIPNSTGSAVGISVEHNDCLILCTPGVPSELKVMMEQTIVDLLNRRFPTGEKVSTIRFQTFGLGESSLQQLINQQYSDWPKDVELGFRAGMPLLEVKLTITSSAYYDLRQQCYQRLRGMIGDYIIGEDNSTLAQAVIELLKGRNSLLTTAESCTGGAIAAAITEISGASEVFEAGFVTYSNRIKESLIAVDKNDLDKHGAVSEAVVIQMAAGALANSGADYTIAVTGIAGPGGGSPEKPVGTVWIAWGSKSSVQARKFSFNVNRKMFQQLVTAIALDLLRRELLSIKNEPRYFGRY